MRRLLFYDKVTTKIDVENLTLKSNQELVILEDGSEWKREGFCRLIPLDADKNEKLPIEKDTTKNLTCSTFDFEEPASPIRIGNLLRNKDCKRKATDPDIMTIKIVVKNLARMQQTSDPIKMCLKISK